MNLCLLQNKGSEKLLSGCFFYSNQPLIYFYVFLFWLGGSHFSPLWGQPEISIETIATGFDSPVDIVNAGDERLFIVEQDGVIKIIDGDQQVLATPFLDIDPAVGSNGNEQGLLGLAFHPNYAANGYFYVYYTQNNGNTRVSRFSVDGSNPNIADPNSEFILLEATQPFSNHNGGSLKFGPDGYLYIGLGDGGSGGDPNGNGQNRLTFLGKILRIDINSGNPYSIPDTNPFAFEDSTLDEIWALGVRNPWRFTFDRVTGDMWIADVGQNNWEEIDFQPAGSPGGQNYGWRCYEGLVPYNNNPDQCPDVSQITMPIHVYSNDFTTGCSVTGGFVYRGEAFPELYGHYLFTDFCSGRIWSITPDGAGGWNDVELLNSTNNEFSSFGEDVAGELYLAGRTSGKIYSIVDVCSTFAVAGQVTNETCAGDSDGSISLSVENGTSPYNITWSNGSTLVNNSSLSSGTYNVTVLDNSGCERSETFEVTNGSPVAPVVGVVDNSLSVPDIYAEYQWLWNGNAISGANQPAYEAEISGNYSVEVTSAAGCIAVSEAVQIVVNTLDELQINNLTVSPNPFKDNIHVEVDAKRPGDYQLTVRDLNGKKLFESRESINLIFEKNISLKNLPAGVYLFSIERNGLEVTKKLTRQ
ncbi:MAG: PQQ-dependent sugar dehydrogenase [Saprospiraceae bacterium]|nr:PQQ-dependent sugar dehydrogenase [Saprospiraceae bacterium]MCB9326332.1 PQQ-dependent sugar dehydrogenase [Lewinellaceae bacterium]